jgi:large subunit ribosomal protein L22
MALEKKQRDPNVKKETGQKAAPKEPPKKADAKKEAAKKDTSKKKAPAKKADAKKGRGGKSTSSETKKDAAKKAAPKAKKEAPKPVPIVVRASSRYVRVTPRKARLVANQVRGLHIDQARALLEFSPRGAARDIQKLIDSAASNAENNHDLVADEMHVAEITVDEGPTLKRFRTRARGSGSPILKRTSHIAVALSPDEEI